MPSPGAAGQTVQPGRGCSGWRSRRSNRGAVANRSEGVDGLRNFVLEYLKICLGEIAHRLVLLVANHDVDEHRRHPPRSVPGARSGACPGVAAEGARMAPKTTKTVARSRGVLIQLSRCRIVVPSRPVPVRATLGPGDDSLDGEKRVTGQHAAGSRVHFDAQFVGARGQRGNWQTADLLQSRTTGWLGEFDGRLGDQLPMSKELSIGGRVNGRSQIVKKNGSSAVDARRNGSPRFG